MIPAAKTLKKPNKTASFKEYILYYMNRKGWDQITLAQSARLNQSSVSKIINGNYSRTKIEVFVCLFLALQLTVQESKDLLSRAERAFSPASEVHETYQKLIAICATMPVALEESRAMLEYADKYLSKRGIDPLPNAYAVKE